MENSIESSYVQQAVSEQSGNTRNNIPETFRLEFHGSASEYFMIWFVNLFLTIVTDVTHGAIEAPEKKLVEL